MKSRLIAKLFTCVCIFGFYTSLNAASPDYDLVREAGDIKGAVTICGDVAADVLIYAPGTSYSAVTDGGGNFKLSYVQQGTYDLIIKKGGDPIGTVSQVTVVKKQTVDVGTNNFCVDLDNDGFFPPQDCDDNNPTINPVAIEICGDGIDNNCNNVTDEGCISCTDFDKDGFFAQAGCGTILDCNDSVAAINPQANESCDGVDNNCDGIIDESGANQTNYYFDGDGDGFGISSNSVLSCVPPTGYISQPDDCNDSSASIYPGAPEVCDDGIDNNCSGGIDEGCPVACLMSINNVNPTFICGLNPTDIQVSGANFTMDAQVFISSNTTGGSTHLPTIFGDNFTLFSTVPAIQAGTYDVIVEDQGGCQTVLPDGLVVEDNLVSPVCLQN